MFWTCWYMYYIHAPSLHVLCLLSGTCTQAWYTSLATHTAVSCTSLLKQKKDFTTSSRTHSHCHTVQAWAQAVSREAQTSVSPSVKYIIFSNMRNFRRKMWLLFPAGLWRSQVWLTVTGSRPGSHCTEDDWEGDQGGHLGHAAELPSGRVLDAHPGENLRGQYLYPTGHVHYCSNTVCFYSCILLIWNCSMPVFVTMYSLCTTENFLLLWSISHA